MALLNQPGCFPVWVGSLKETVKEADLIRVFSKYGKIHSCRVVREKGVSKKFGYVNFFREVDAETAAKKANGFKIGGIAIKTKGPQLLSQQGHFTYPRPAIPSKTTSPKETDFKPFTDCSFFMKDDSCAKGSTVSLEHLVEKTPKT